MICGKCGKIIEPGKVHFCDTKPSGFYIKVNLTEAFRFIKKLANLMRKDHGNDLDSPSKNMGSD